MFGFGMIPLMHCLSHMFDKVDTAYKYILLVVLLLFAVMNGIDQLAYNFGSESTYTAVGMIVSALYPFMNL